MFDRVESLHLAGHEYTDESLNELRDLQHLKELTLQHTMVSPERVQQFEAERPDCNVVFHAAPPWYLLALPGDN